MANNAKEELDPKMDIYRICHIKSIEKCHIWSEILQEVRCILLHISTISNHSICV